MSKKIRHTKEAPKEWSGLLDYAERVVPALPPDKNVGRWPFFKLARRVSKLPNGALFHNYYFGLGETMTVMADMLEEGNTKTELIHDAARLLVKTALERRFRSVSPNKPFVPILYDLDSVSLSGPFVDLAKQAKPRMDAPKRSLIDALNFVAHYRRYLAKSGSRLKTMSVAPYLFRESRQGPLLAEHIGENALGGATRVVQNLLTGGGDELTQEEARIPLTLGLNRISDPRPYIGSARLRLDEFHHDKGWKRSGAEGHFDWGYLQTPPSVPPEKDDRFPVLHEDRINCPALPAGRLVREIGTNILPQIIKTAHTIIPAQEYPALFA